MKRALKLVGSLAVTVFFSWLAFRGTHWSEQWESLREANYAWVLPYLGICFLIHIARTLRWGYLLSGIEKVPFRKLNEASAIGFMMLIVLPFRLGEFARPFLIAQRSSIRRSAAMTTVVLERIVDGLTVAILLRVLLFFVPDSTTAGYVRFGANVMFAIFASGLLFLIFGYWQQQRAIALVRATVGRVAPKLGEKAAGIVETFVGALRQLPSGRNLALFFVFTGVYWGLNGWGMSLLARAFECSGADPMCQPLSLSAFQGYVVMCSLVVLLMIPAAPGMMGTFQAGVKLGLTLFVPAAIANSKGLAYANVLWLSQTSQQILYGLVMLSLSHLSFRDVAGKLSQEARDAAAPEPSDSRVASVVGRS